MNKSTLVLIVLATLVLGSLIGGAVGQEASKVADNQNVSGTQITRSGRALDFRYLKPGDVEVEFSESGRSLPVALGENFIGRSALMKSDTIVIDIETDGETEYKAIMKQGDTLVYSWRTDGAEVFYDFHAHDDAFGDKFFTRYSEGDATDDSGAVVAAYDGEHGWYLRNYTDSPVQVTLNVSGFYSEIVKIDL